MIHKLAIVSAFICAASIASAQSEIRTSSGDIAMLRALDTITGSVTDYDVRVGTSVPVERLRVTVEECRYPKSNPNADAFVYLKIYDEKREEPEFDGWMIASSPALSALEHSRYDVWVLGCKSS
jgi:hypothetical protein